MLPPSRRRGGVLTHSGWATSDSSGSCTESMTPSHRCPSSRVCQISRGTDRGALSRTLGQPYQWNDRLPMEPSAVTRDQVVSRGAEELEMKSQLPARRLAAILAADVVGYSRLIGLDEEGTLARIKAIRLDLIDRKLADHHGRMVKTTGDGILVEFQSVIDALRCANEMQAELAERNAELPAERRIDWRIGINVGDIVVEDGDIFGDGVNVASRLESMAEPGGICVSARVQEYAAGKLDNVVFADRGEQQLHNIAEPVRVFRVSPGPPPSAPLPLPHKPLIAVLSFTNLSDDPEQAFFAEGIAEDIITALSRSRSLFVIAHHSSFSCKDKAVAVRDIGRELGVRYVLEGSVRRSGNRVRATVQLIEAATERHLWAERYDHELTDIFAVQDEITERVSAAIQPAVERSERERAASIAPESLNAWESYHRGMSRISTPRKM
jgi:adenylate cyclase